MLNELAPWLDQEKYNEYVRRVDGRSTKDSLASEAELAVLWALSSLDRNLVIEPKDIGGSSNIDAFVPDGFSGHPTAVEVTAISDDTMAGKEHIQRAANIIAQFCNRIRKGAGNRLYFFFSEWQTRDGYWLERLPSVAPKYEISESVKVQLKQWVLATDWPNPQRIHLKDEFISVDVTAQESASKRISARSTVPALIYHPIKNPLFRAIQKKAQQMKDISKTTMKCVFIVDVGCRILSELKQKSASGSQIAPADVISDARDRFKLDIVVVLSPKMPANRGLPASFYASEERRKHWAATIFLSDDKNKPQFEEAIKSVVDRFPEPRVDANMARQLHVQGVFKPQSNSTYVRTKITFNIKKGKCTVKISARLLQEYIAGRITRERFENEAFGPNSNNFFEHGLSRGQLISNIQFESAGIDEDDDWIVFELFEDAAATPLKS